MPNTPAHVVPAMDEESKRGGVSKFTPSKRQIVLDSISRGESQECAAALAGVSAKTVNTWLRKSKQGVALYVGFYSDYKNAERSHESKCVQGIFRAGIGDWVEEETTTTYKDGDVVNTVVKKKKGKPDWCALAWLLERKWPDEYGKDVELMRAIKQEYLKRKNAAPDALADAPSTTD